MARLWMAALLAFACAACAPELNWREHRSEGARLSQLFPCKPVRQQRQIVVAGREVLLVLQVCDAGGVSWALAQVDVGDPAAVGPVLEALRAAVQHNVGAPSATTAAWAVAGSTPNPAAGRLQLQGQSPIGRPLAAEVLLFVQGTVVVQLTVLGPRLSAAAVETFFESVRVISFGGVHTPPARFSGGDGGRRAAEARA